MSEALYEQRPLGDAVERHIGGGTPPRQVPSYWKGEIPWASVKDFSEQKGVIQDTEEHISSAGLHASASNLIPEKMPLVCTRMAVGRAALPVVPMAINQDVKALFPASGVSAEYLLKLMQYIQPLAEGRAVGSTVKGIRIQDYLNIPVPLAPQEAQPVIAQILDTLDTAIRETEALIDKLKAVKQGLLNDLLTRGIDADGQLRPPQSEAPQLYKESPLGWIPREWECREFSALAEYLNGNTFDAAAWTDTGFPIIRIQNLNGSRDFNYYAGAIQEKWHVHPGDLLFAWSGQRGVSFGARLWDGPEGVLNQHIFRVLPKESLVSKAFLYRLLRFRQMNIEDAAHGFKDSFLHVTRGELGSVNAGVPPLDEQERVELRITAYESKLLAEGSELGKLQSMKIGLMDDLLTGRVRVTPLLESVQQPVGQTGA
ncbi:restriction endonuclease subunit S [Stutzerimonas stutzeri]|jgi:type I restriction enzyme S subunit|uniref:restriction endonuclease subunit S n=1 Tax=Stutzerimonas stutzeri TaxID=316 RepID=UPI001C48B3D4|nr:restriction endonuclease subunit S [Stutzerimonas stutzeri]